MFSNTIKVNRCIKTVAGKLLQLEGDGYPGANVESSEVCGTFHIETAY